MVGGRPSGPAPRPQRPGRARARAAGRSTGGRADGHAGRRRSGRSGRSTAAASAAAGHRDDEGHQRRAAQRGEPAQRRLGLAERQPSPRESAERQPVAQELLQHPRGRDPQRRGRADAARPAAARPAGEERGRRRARISHGTGTDVDAGPVQQRQQERQAVERSRATRRCAARRPSHRHRQHRHADERQRPDAERAGRPARRATPPTDGDERRPPDARTRARTGTHRSPVSRGQSVERALSACPEARCRRSARRAGRSPGRSAAPTPGAMSSSSGPARRRCSQHARTSAGAPGDRARLCGRHRPARPASRPAVWAANAARGADRGGRVAGVRRRPDRGPRAEFGDRRVRAEGHRHPGGGELGEPVQPPRPLGAEPLRVHAVARRPTPRRSTAASTRAARTRPAARVAHELGVLDPVARRRPAGRAVRSTSSTASSTWSTAASPMA